MKWDLMFALAAVASISIVRAQAPALAWEEFFEGSLPGQDVAHDLIILPDNSVYVTGEASHEVQQGTATTLRYSSSGDLMMSDHVYGPSQATRNIGEAFALAPDGSIYVTGAFSANNGDHLLVKYGPAGRLWRKNYEAYWFGSELDRAYDVAVAPDGSVYMAGSITSLSGMMLDDQLLKVDSAGTQLWTAQTGISSSDEWATDVAVSSTGEAYMAGHWWNMDPFGMDAAVARFTTDGSVQWDEPHASPSFEDRVNDIMVTPNDHVVICGKVSNGNDLDIFVLERDEQGALIWQFQMDGTGNGNDEAIALTEMPDGRIAVACNAVMGTIPTIVTIILQDGEDVSVEEFNGENGTGAWASDIALAPDGRILISGHEASNGNGQDGTILCYSMAGDPLWNIAHDVSGLNDRFTAIGVNSFGDVIATGTSHTSVADSRYITVQYGNTVGISENGTPSVLHAFPSICELGSTIRIRTTEASIDRIAIYDDLGRSVQEFAGADIQRWTPLHRGVFTITGTGASARTMARVVVF